YLRYTRQSYDGFVWATSAGLPRPLIVLPGSREQDGADIRLVRLDDQLASLRHQLTLLTSYRNSLAHISCLPDKVVSEIFVRYAWATDTLHNLRWTKLLLVCRRWRNVGLTTPALWSCVGNSDHVNRQAIPRQLQLSGSHPLTVAIEEDDSENVLLSATAPLQPHLDRICSIQLRSLKGPLQQFLSMLALERRPALRTLSLHLITYDVAEEPLVLSGPQTERIACGLRVLDLYDVGVDWSRFSGLTSMTVGYRTGSTLLLSVPILFDVLRQSPGLTDVRLRHCLALLHPSDGNEPGDVELPVLEVLEYQGHGSVCAELLSRMRLHPGTRFYLSIEGLPDAPDVQPFLQALAPHLQTSDMSPRPLLQLHSAFDALVWTSAPIRHYFVPMTSRENRLMLAVDPESDAACRRILSTIMRQLPGAANVETLDVRFVTNRNDSDLFSYILDLLPNLRTIVISTRQISLSFIDALRAQALRLVCDQGVAEEQRRPTPLRRIHWDRTLFLSNELIGAAQKDELAAQLSGLLREYARAGFSLEELVIDDTNSEVPRLTLKVRSFFF
ncbi:hypothetical protein HDZ31DRAFT_32305, partial [Schizophyllum fasciatum]